MKLRVSTNTQLLEEKIDKLLLLLVRTRLAFPRDTGEPLLLAVMSGGARQTAVQALGHGLWVVVSTRAGKLCSVPGALRKEKTRPQEWGWNQQQGF